MKESHKELILEAFRKNGNVMTLGYILQHHWGYEFRARATELRRLGYGIILERGETPTKNLYRLVEPHPSGQMAFA